MNNTATNTATCPTVRKQIGKTTYIVGFFAEQIEKLGITHGDQEVKAVIRITHNEEQSSFPVSQSIQLQLIISRDLTQLCNVEHGKASAAGNQNVTSF